MISETIRVLQKIRANPAKKNICDIKTCGVSETPQVFLMPIKC